MVEVDGLDICSKVHSKNHLLILYNGVFSKDSKYSCIYIFIIFTGIVYTFLELPGIMVLEDVYTMQECTKCQRKLDFDNFYRDSRYKDRVKYRRTCKACCHNKYLHSYRNKNVVFHNCANCGTRYQVNAKYAPNTKYCTRPCHAASKARLEYSQSFLTPSLQSYVDGLMLSDITIRPDGSFGWNLKYQEFSEYIANQLKPYEAYSKATSDPNIFRGRSYCHPDIKKQRQRWYPDGIKIVPKDVKIDITSVLMLYLGDGCLHKTRGNITLYTLSFTEEENEFLVHKLSCIGISSRVIPVKKHFAIYLSRPNAEEFLKILGGISPIRCYDYKFNMPDREVYNRQQKDWRRRKNEKDNQLSNSAIEAR